MIWGIFASLAATVCTLVDALLVGNLVGSNGLTVVNLSTPVFLIFALFGITIGVGANVSTGRYLGAADTESANRVFRAQLATGLLVGFVSLLPLVFRDSFFTFLGVTEELYPLAQQYLTVVMWSAPIFVMYHILSVSVRTDSDPKLAALASGVVIITNLVLDIVFMGVLEWGIIGASASLCIGETLGVVVLLTHFLKKQALLKLRVKLPRWEDIKDFAINGFGIGSANVFQAVVMLVFNTILMRRGGNLGAAYVAIYGVLYTVSMIPFAVYDGASNALSTVTSFFVGESDEDGILAVRNRAVGMTILFGCLFAGICLVFSEELVLLFGIEDGEVLPLASRAMGLFALSTVFTGINMVHTALWQTLGRAKLAGLMSLLRNCLLMLAAGVVLITRWNINGVSMAFVCTEVLCSGLALLTGLLCPTKKYFAARYAATGRVFESNYLIQTQSMEQISADLERICDEWEIGMKQAFFINFICEELLLNVIKFGLKDDGKNYYVSVKRMEKNGDYVLRIRDNVSIYNPFESQGDEIDAGVLTLIRKKTKYCDYQRKMKWKPLMEFTCLWCCCI